LEEPALNLIRAFVAVAECRSFAKAAQKLGMTSSSVSRLVKTLEQQLGAPLIMRTTRSMSLTEVGQRYFADCSVGFEQFRVAYRRMQMDQGALRGPLKVSMSVSFGRQQVVPHLAAFMQTYPELELDLVMTDRYVDIVTEGVAVAIRIGRMQDSSLVARKLLKNRRILVAAPSYLERHGIPVDVDDLHQHQCLVSTANHDGQLWRLFGPTGEHVHRPSGRMRADNADAIVQVCLDGFGIAFHSAVSMAEAIEAGRLCHVLPQWCGRETGVYSVFPPGPVLPAARAWVEFLVFRWRDSTGLGHDRPN
jgi:DNA-binding transcriptional LysR family regulator